MGQELRHLELRRIRGSKHRTWSLALFALLALFVFSATTVFCDSGLGGRGGLGTAPPFVLEYDGDKTASTYSSANEGASGVFTRLIYAPGSLYRDGTHVHVSTQPSDALDLAYWTTDTNQTGITGNKTGSFDLTTTGTLVVDTTTLVVNATGYEDRVGIGTATPTAPLEIAGTSTISNTAGDITIDASSDIALSDDTKLPSGKKLILDSDDSGDSYLVHNNASNYVSIFVDGTEVARFKP